jgi:hypothetical protein
MPLGRFLKILLGGLVALAVLFVLSVEFSRTQAPASLSDYIGDYAAYEQTAKELFSAAYACAARICDWLKSFDHDDWLAALTGTIALFTAVLAWSTRKLWKAGEKQIALAREAMGATHRPRVAVRRMAAVLEPEEPIKIEFAIVNVGETAASGYTWNTAILYLKAAGAIQEAPSFDPGTAGSSDVALQPGEGKNIQFMDGGDLGPKQLRDITYGTEILHVIGYITYRDKRGATRRTGFLRHYDRESRRFRVVDDPEYEYQD